MRKIAMTMTAGAMALVLTAACSDDEAGETDARAPEDVLMHDTLPEPAMAPGDTAGAFTVVLNEWRVRLARDTIEAANGPTVFRARNNGTYPHILEVEGQGNEWATDTIQPGEWATLEADLQPGTYEVYCPIEGEHGNHRQQGMTERLVVR